MNATETFDVIIVGLGPTGLTLAHCLGQRGHRVLVLEREPKFYGNARAVYTDGECMVYAARRRARSRGRSLSAITRSQMRSKSRRLPM